MRRGRLRGTAAREWDTTGMESVLIQAVGIAISLTVGQLLSPTFPDFFGWVALTDDRILLAV
jgi:hypothetical protein